VKDLLMENPPIEEVIARLYQANQLSGGGAELSARRREAP
jgi:hypothetical protein